MIIFHGGFSEIQKPEILEPKRTLDFGSGFYATTNFEQAKKWAITKKDRFHFKNAIVNQYDFDKIILQNSELNCKIFENADEDWLDFVVSNRQDINFSHDYDVVFGAVANDNVYASINLYEQGFLRKNELLEELRTWKYVDQFCFHTEKALKHLQFIKSEEVL